VNARRVKTKLQDVLLQIIHCLGLHNKTKSHFSLLFYNMYCICHFPTFLEQKRYEHTKSLKRKTCHE